MKRVKPIERVNSKSRACKGNQGSLQAKDDENNYNEHTIFSNVGKSVNLL